MNFQKLYNIRFLLGIIASLFYSAQAIADVLTVVPVKPGWSHQEVVQGKKWMVATANSEASRAAAEILKAGGNAVDAAITAAIMLTLVEPQSSGIGGGAFLLHYDPRKRSLKAYDGRETAPSRANADRFLAENKSPLAFGDAVNHGLSVGVPGLLKVLELAHQKGGRLPWNRLLEPTIALAENGFVISPRLHYLLSTDSFLRQDEEARKYFYNLQGDPLPAGTLLKNPELATVLRQVANQGASFFYRGEIPDVIVKKVTGRSRAGDLSTGDFQRYQAYERTPVCGPYRIWRVCGMPPPSSGGIAVLQILGLLERFPIKTLGVQSAEAIHLYSEASRLAFADRNRYIADPDFSPAPVEKLLSESYLGSRSHLIQPDQVMEIVKPGEFPGVRAGGMDSHTELSGTSHLSIVDSDGQAVSMTSTIESAFGSRIMVKGFLLNNQMTDFSFKPEDENGLIANRVEAGKRPRSSMSPTMVFGPDGRVEAVLGSPGGEKIISYVAKTLLGILDAGLDPLAAIRLPNISNRGKDTELEAERALDYTARALTKKGHTIQFLEMTSGVQAIVRSGDGWQGAADPRREGRVIGE